MAKREVPIPPHHPIEPELLSILEKWFSPKEIERLREKGGRITIGLAFGPKKVTKRPRIDSQFVEFVRQFSGSEKELRDRLEILTTKELQSICKELAIPFRSDARTNELLAAIASFVAAPRKWDKIMGQLPEKH